MPYLGTKPLSQRPKQLFQFIFERHPTSLNVATLNATSMLADPWSRHPYHVRTTRRLDQFDPTKLHWRVSAPLGLSRSAFVRDKAAKRVREAIRDELRAKGWASDGRRLPGSGGSGVVETADLAGAMQIMLVKDAYAVTATIEQVRAQAKSVVRKILQRQSDETQQAQPQDSQAQSKDPQAQEPSPKPRGGDIEPQQKWRKQYLSEPGGDARTNKPITTYRPT